MQRVIPLCLILFGCTGGFGTPAASDSAADGGPPLPPPFAPSGEVCTQEADVVAVDEDGDGLVDEECACAVGASRACSLGGADGVGICRFGTQSCEGNAEFASWGQCVAAVGPQAEVCDDGVDQDCDGKDQPCNADPGPVDPEDPKDPKDPNNSQNGVDVGSAPDYVSCAKLPLAGKQSYGKCAAHMVLVIVNDGKTPEMTCCPLGAKDILTTDPKGQHVVRKGLCAADEVATGMLEPMTPSVYCTKFDANKLRRTPPVSSIYSTGNLPGSLGQIAATYAYNDTCICPDGTMAIGGHTSQNNACGEQCVRLERR